MLLAGCGGARGFGEGWLENAGATSNSTSWAEATIKQADEAFAKRADKEQCKKAAHLYAEVGKLFPKAPYLGTAAFLRSECGLGADEGVASTDSAGSAKVESLIKQADEAWAKRIEKEECQKAAERYAEAGKLDPRSYYALSMASRAYYVLADYYLTGDENKKARMETYNKGVEVGEKAMATDPEFTKHVRAGEKTEEAAQVLKKDHIDGLYWTASNLGKWSVDAGFVTLLSNKNRIKSLIERVAALDETYFYAASHRYLGTLYAKAPSFAGGDMVKSLEHYKKSLEIAPNYFGTRVLKAEFYCTKLQKAEDKGKECFKEDLEYVINTPVDIVPELTPENTLEKRKAEALLKQISEKFAY